MAEKTKRFVVPEENKTPKYANTFRVGITDSEIVLDFGQVAPSDPAEAEVVVNVSSRVVIPPDRLTSLVFSLFQAGIDYENQFKKSIGGFASINEAARKQEQGKEVSKRKKEEV